jgi:hypothetical protein
MQILHELFDSGSVLLDLEQRWRVMRSFLGAKLVKNSTGSLPLEYLTPLHHHSLLDTCLELGIPVPQSYYTPHHFVAYFLNPLRFVLCSVTGL